MILTISAISVVNITILQGQKLTGSNVLSVVTDYMKLARTSKTLAMVAQKERNTFNREREILQFFLYMLVHKKCMIFVI